MAIMAKPIKNYFIYISLTFLIFIIAIAFNISPYLRGPGPYPPDWRWAYLFANTIYKIWAPLIILVVIGILIKIVEELEFKTLIKNTKIIVVLFIISSFLFQISIVYFSRSGIGVLLHRIIDPNLNGYFTTSLHITNINTFLSGYSQNVLSFSMHAQGHPPGAILLYYLLNQIFSHFTLFNKFVTSIHIQHQDVNIVWSNLNTSQKSTAIFSMILIPFLSSLVLIPIYLSTKALYDIKTALRAVQLYIFIPSIVLFIPINDVFLPLFTMFSFTLLIFGLKSQKSYLVFLSGIIFSLGLFFSISILPVLLIMFLFLYLFNYKKSIAAGLVFYVAGLLVVPFILLLNAIDPLKMFLVLMSGLPKGRKYSTWIVYNIYDFYIFSGIPVLVLFFIYLCNSCKQLFKKKILRVDLLFLSFILMVVLLDVSGSVRGEAARIWIPFYSFLVIIISKFITQDLQINKKYFMFLILLQCIQIIVMQEFWVTLW